MSYLKVRFTSKQNGSTAGLVLQEKDLEGKGVAEISRYFPISEATKMDRLEISKPFDTFEDAFLSEFI